jgi:hypothetical protein
MLVIGIVGGLESILRGPYLEQPVTFYREPMLDPSLKSDTRCHCAFGLCSKRSLRISPRVEFKEKGEYFHTASPFSRKRGSLIRDSLFSFDLFAGAYFAVTLKFFNHSRHLVMSG